MWPGSHIPEPQREVERAVTLSVNFTHFGKEAQVQQCAKRATRALELAGLSDLVVVIVAADPKETNR